MVLAASACESARILLNSRSTQFPHGLANSSGVVGRYLTDTTGTDVGGFIPRMVDHVPHNEDGVGGAHLYMPWWLDNRNLDFPRGYHIEIWGGLYQPSYGFMGGIQSYPPGGGYGTALKNDYRKYYGATVGFSGRGEMIPNEDSYCELDPDVVDRWGIPVLRFHWKWSDYEYDQVQHMQQTFRALIEEMGAVVRRRCRRGKKATASPTAARSSTSWASPAWATTPDVGAQRALPGPRREEPLRGRRRAVRVPGRQEPDLDDPGALDEDIHFHCRLFKTWRSPVRSTETQRVPMRSRPDWDPSVTLCFISLAGKCKNV